MNDRNKSILSFCIFFFFEGGGHCKNANIRQKTDFYNCTFVLHNGSQSVIFEFPVLIGELTGYPTKPLT